MAEPRSISVVIPVFNAEPSLEELVARLNATLQPTGRSYEIVMVDDASTDGSWSVLCRLKEQHPDRLRVARLMRNQGQHNAVLCGLSLASGAVVVTMDDDLQNPPEEALKLIDAIDAGYDLAIASYDTKEHSWSRNRAGAGIDRLLRRLFNLPRDFQLTSFRAVDRLVVDHVVEMGGVYPYVTCMLLSHSSRYTNVSVDHHPRRHGTSNYSVKRGALLAANLVFSYSTLPVSAVAVIAGLALVLAVGGGVAAAAVALFTETGVPGWASTLVVISMLNAAVLLCLLIFAVYLSRLSHQLGRGSVGFSIRELRE